MSRRTRFGVLGDPIAHSLSPVLHRAGYQALGLPFAYDALRVEAGTLASVVGDLDDSWGGLSLTMPLKREAMDLIDSVSAAGSLVGAVNTLLRGEDNVWTGDNTDLAGAASAIREKFSAPLEHVVIWGAGATAASTLLAAATLGCRSFELHVRDMSRAIETLAAAGRFEAPVAVVVRALGTRVDADLLISTIPALPQESLVDSIERADAVFDVLYHPWPTPLARWAQARPLISGLDLLVHQAALQFSLFTGVEVPLAVMRDAGLAQLHPQPPSNTQQGQ